MVSIALMRAYLSKSLSSVNKNKIYGLLAEVDFRRKLKELGYEDHVSAGGWIARSTFDSGAAEFGENTVALFPETVLPDKSYPQTRTPPAPPNALHTICSTMHQIGIKSFFCSPVITDPARPETGQWNLIQLGIPGHASFQSLDKALSGFAQRERSYNFLRNENDATAIPDTYVPDEFTKEMLRVSFQTRFMAEVSDIDGILWGKTHTYPVEIKEKTPAEERRIGEYFGLDVGPFVKLAFYAAKRGNLHSIFVVREIDDETSRKLVAWRFVTFEVLAQYASWVFGGGGPGMGGGRSAVVKIPKSRFSTLDATALAKL